MLNAQKKFYYFADESKWKARSNLFIRLQSSQICCAMLISSCYNGGKRCLFHKGRQCSSFKSLPATSIWSTQEQWLSECFEESACSSSGSSIQLLLSCRVIMQTCYWDVMFLCFWDWQVQRRCHFKWLYRCSTFADPIENAPLQVCQHLTLFVL
jgi:hypothetical protein